MKVKKNKKHGNPRVSFFSIKKAGLEEVECASLGGLLAPAVTFLST